MFLEFSMRTILAFLIAPASFGLLIFVFSLFLSSSSTSASEGLWILKFSAIVGYPIAIVIGIPLYFLLSKIGANGFFTYALMSLVFTALLTAYFIVRPVYLENGGDLSTVFLEARILQMAVLAFASFLTVSVFWLIARPDRMPPA